MAKYSVCVVDDVLQDAENCAAHLQQMEEIGEIHVLTNPFQVLPLIKKTTIDILFMDIEMPGASGLEIVKSIPEASRPALVLVTNYRTFAVDGFSLSAADYVLKPVSFSALSVALSKALRYLNVSLNIFQLPEREYVLYPIKYGGIDTLLFKDVICFEGNGNYVTAHIRGGTAIELRKKLYEIMEDVPASYFQRIHHSYIVNMRFAGRLLESGKALFVKEFAEIDPLPVSRAHRAALMNKVRF